MKKAFYVVIAIMGLWNAGRDSFYWYSGAEATSITWLFAVLFSVGVALHAICDLAELSAADRGGRS